MLICILTVYFYRSVVKLQTIAALKALSVRFGTRWDPLRGRSTPRSQMAPLAGPWRPLRGAAAHLWWAHLSRDEETRGRARELSNSGPESADH